MLVIKKIIWILIIGIFVSRSQAINYLKRNGITWTFDKEISTSIEAGKYQYGTFVNGEYWIINGTGDANDPNVAVVAIDPNLTIYESKYVHGSMINPDPSLRTDRYPHQAWDSRKDSFYSELSIDPNIASPLVMEPNQSLVSAISWIPGESGCPSLVGGVPRSMIKTYGVLTCLDSTPEANTYRPAYCGDNKKFYTTNDVNKAVLTNLAFVADTPSITTIKNYFKYEFVDLGYVGDGDQYFLATNNNSGTQQWVSRYMGDVCLYLLLDEDKISLRYGENKTAVINKVVQLGIDLYGVISNGGYWIGNGGFGAGRKIAILLAGLLLNDADMLNIGNVVWPYGGFGEDKQVFYISATNVYTQPYTLNVYSTFYSAGKVNVTNGSTEIIGVGTSWVPGSAYAKYFGLTNDNRANSTTGTAYAVSYIGDSNHLYLTTNYDCETGDNKYYKLAKFLYYGHGQGSPAQDWPEFTDADLGIPEWGRQAFESYRGRSWFGISYRISDTASNWCGMILTAHLLGLKDEWNANDLFDYQDRFVEIEKKRIGHNPSESDFAASMWDTYRLCVDGRWTRYDANDYYSQGYVIPDENCPHKIVNDHQISMTKRLEQLGHILATYSEEELPDKLHQLKTFIPKKRENQAQAVANHIAQFLQSLTNESFR